MAAERGVLRRPVALGPAALAFFTGRASGVSDAPFGPLNLSCAVGDAAGAVAANRRLAAAACGLDPAGLAWMNQVHGCQVSYVAGRQSGPDVPAADAICPAWPWASWWLTARRCSSPIRAAGSWAQLTQAVRAWQLASFQPWWPR